MLEMLKKREMKHEGPVNVSVDGQYDSPGYCAMMCKVTAIDSESGYVVGLQTIQRKETENKSARMEIEGVRRFLDEMKENKIKVDCLTSDRNSGVTKMMETDYKETQHKRDPWHMVKGITKDLKMEAKKKTKFPNLELFIHPIKNHMWFSIVESKGDGILCREILISSLFHLLGIHSWKKGNICKQLKAAISKLIGTDKDMQKLFKQMNPSKCSTFFQELKFEKITQCCHAQIDPNTDDAGYLNPVSKEYFYILLKLTADKFLKDVVYLSPDLATSKVENFNSIATGIYTPKRTYFPYDSYTMRSYLSVLHYNNNERSEKEGNRTVLRTLTYPAKALGGEFVRKKVKSKATITYKHNMIEKCLDVFEKGLVILENVTEIPTESGLNEEVEEIYESEESCSDESDDSSDESEVEELFSERSEIKKETSKCENRAKSVSDIDESEDEEKSFEKITVVFPNVCLMKCSDESDDSSDESEVEELFSERSEIKKETSKCENRVSDIDESEDEEKTFEKSETKRETIIDTVSSKEEIIVEKDIQKGIKICQI
uniref:Uncharacterized protein n=1 Tax=Panagrolaimus sp. ES5 TaxID=591445 RepID=A0AC34G2P5_9BILA